MEPSSLVPWPASSRLHENTSSSAPGLEHIALPSLGSGPSLALATLFLKAGRKKHSPAWTCSLFAGQQTAIDAGSWVLAQELLWEDDPPYHNFVGHRTSDSSRAAISRLCDPRWAEVAMARLHDVDAWNDRRARIQQRQLQHQGQHQQHQPPQAQPHEGDANATPAGASNAARRRPPRRPPQAGAQQQQG